MLVSFFFAFNLIPGSYIEEYKLEPHFQTYWLNSCLIMLNTYNQTIFWAFEYWILKSIFRESGLKTELIWQDFLLIIDKDFPTCTFNSSIEKSSINWSKGFQQNSSWIIKPEVISVDCRNKVLWITSSNTVFEIVPVEINTWINMYQSEITTELEISNIIKHPCSCDLGDTNWAEVVRI